MLLDIGTCIGSIIERCVGSGGDVVLRAELLGEILRSFELRARCTRPKHRNLLRTQCVGEAIDQRLFGADDDEANEVGFAIIKNILMAGQCHAIAIRRNPCVTGRAYDAGRSGAAF